MMGFRTDFQTRFQGRFTRILASVLTGALFALPAAAQTQRVSDHVMPGTIYYGINNSGAIVQPLNGALTQTFGTLAPQLATSTGLYNLLHWWRSKTAPPAPPQRYVRAQHFGPWMDLPTDSTCFNVRALVLARDTRRPLTTVAGQPCIVDSGAWYDPYTNQTYTKAADLQIDHVVALKNAYISGGFNWDWRTRCAYANFLGNPYHLIAVYGPANTQKADLTPAGYQPPNVAYRCEFIANVLRIKFIWGLWISEPEGQAIMETARALGCDARHFMFTGEELFRQRRIIGQMRDICPAGPPPPPINESPNAAP